MPETHFCTTIAGIELCVSGDYESPDKSVGWDGGFTVNKVWLEHDLTALDIQELLPRTTMQQLEHEGFMGACTAKREAKQDAKEIDRADKI